MIGLKAFILVNVLKQPESVGVISTASWQEVFINWDSDVSRAGTWLSLAKQKGGQRQLVRYEKQHIS